MCVIDDKPRNLGAVEIAVLKALRDLVNDTLAGKIHEGDTTQGESAEKGIAK